MIIVPVSYNGTNINDGVTYNAYIERGQANGAPSAKASYVKRAGAWPMYAGRDFAQGGVYLTVDCSPGAPSAGGLMQKFENLNALFSPEDETPYLFIVKDTSDSDTQYQVYAVPDGPPVFGNDGANYSIHLAFDDPVWQSVLQNSQTFSTTSSTDTTSVTNNGNADAYPVLEVTPGTAVGWTYSRAVQYLPSGTTPWPGRACCLTSTTDGTTFDTAALIAGGKMQASTDPAGACGDLRVLRDGTQVDFWIGGAGTTDTRVWVVADMPAAANMTLGTAISTTDTIAEIVLNNTTAQKALISALPNQGRLIVDSSLGSTDTEEFTYTSKTINNKKLAFTVNARAVRNTDTFTHAVGDNVRFLPYDFTLIYGNLTCAAADVSDTYKTVLDLTNSNNGTQVWSNFYEDAALRASIWSPVVRKVSYPSLTRSGVFTSTSDEGDTSPATEMGIKCLSYQSNGNWKADTVQIVWNQYFPDMVTSVTASGEQTQDQSTRPTFSLMARKSATVRATTLWTVSAQSATDYGTWTTWSKASTDYASMPASTYILEFSLIGSSKGATDTYTKVGVSAVTVALTNPPTCFIRSEQSSFRSDFTLYNLTTGENLSVSYPINVGTTLTVDCDPDFPTAKYNGQIVNGAIKTDSVRAAWFRFQAGANSLGYETNLGSASDMTIVIKWYDRKIFL